MQYYGNFVKEWRFLTILYFAIVASKMAVRTCLCIKIGSMGSLCKGVFGGRVSDKTSCRDY